ncbi:MAG: ABC transporter ATP-binding protein [Candidatus Pacearchaeota archaeon]
MENWKLLKKFVVFIKIKFIYFLIGSFLLLLLSFFNFIPIFLTKYIIDEIFPNKNVYLLLWVIFLFFIILTLRIPLGILSTYFLSLHREAVVSNLQKTLLEKIIKAPISYHNKFNPGYLLSRILNESVYLQSFLGESLTNFLRNFLTFICCFFIIFFINFKITFIANIIIFPIVFLTLSFSRIIEKKSFEMQEKISRLFENMEETLDGIFLVKIFNIEEYRMKKFSEKVEEVFRRNVNFSIWNSISTILISYLISVGSLLILGICGIDIIKEKLTLGYFFVTYYVVIYFYNSVQGLSDFYKNIKSVIAVLKRINELLNIEEEATEKGEVLTSIRGEIIFENVNFSYDSSVLLKNISFKINPGEKVAIIGKSGSGKTTLVKLLLGLYPFYSGNIYIDGKELKELNIKNLRNLIKMLPQEVFIFSESIEENIKLGKEEITKEMIIEALKKSGGYEFITKLPQDIKTICERKGAIFSGGEKQRIAIARVFAMSPHLLVIDEATSEIDPVLENLIFKNFFEFMKNKTFIIITHRLKIAPCCDKIILLNNGKIEAIGRHEQLYNENSFYKKLYDESIKKERR